GSEDSTRGFIPKKARREPRPPRRLSPSGPGWKGGVLPSALTANGRRADDAVDQLDIRHAQGGAEHRQVGVLRVQPRQWIDLKEMRVAVPVAAQVDAAGVATAQRSP